MLAETSRRGVEEGAEQHKRTPIGAARVDETDAVIDLLMLRIPAFWMRQVTREDLRTFVRAAILSPRTAVLVARPEGALIPAGYVFAIFDVRTFWLRFALAHPTLSAKILYHRVVRAASLRAASRRRQREGQVDPTLPPFAWSPSDPRDARILGLYVRAEHRRKGIAMQLYFELFDVLTRCGCRRVEEYMGPDYPQYAGKFPEVCGFDLQQCACTGFKITKDLTAGDLGGERGVPSI